MNILTTSLKGGVGKSTISRHLSMCLDIPRVTNDLALTGESNVIQIPSGLKRIPREIKSMPDMVIDFGAMSTAIDPKLAEAVGMADIILIPTLLDPASINATVETYRYLHGCGKPLVVIINNYTLAELRKADIDGIKASIPDAIFFYIKRTTLADRIVVDGLKWDLRVFNVRGLARLKGTLRDQEFVFKRVLEIIDLEVVDEDHAE